MATYKPTNPMMLTGVANVAQIEVGSRVIGSGVGREVYVNARNISARTLTLSQPLYGGAATRTYSFERYRCLFDFSGARQLDRLHFVDRARLSGPAGGQLPVPVE